MGPLRRLEVRVLPLLAGQDAPRHDRLGLYLWGTIVWLLLILLGTVLLVIGGDVLLAY